MISRGAGGNLDFDPTMLAVIALNGLNHTLNRKPLDSPPPAFQVRRHIILWGQDQANHVVMVAT